MPATQGDPSSLLRVTHFTEATAPPPPCFARWAIPMETIMRSSVMELIIGVTVAMGIAVVAASAIDIAVDYYLLDGSRAHSRLR
jgi:hypothetical protein